MEIFQEKEINIFFLVCWRESGGEKEREEREVPNKTM
jgi:hypothetical protein